jgi:hypothetical protein
MALLGLDFIVIIFMASENLALLIFLLHCSLPGDIINIWFLFVVAVLACF